ncbi:NUDIX domain-containing protein [Rossellomorea sp. BNER]|uniref:NUDIX domain-containing protein n=1 Tax=Rossellomorea sp. BNER TaxID=2962031 RepID=UPI003AF24755|nr:NUDIX domain-containing protein [Rossellomorea sp. BNER]
MINEAGHRFLEWMEIRESDLMNYQPLAGSFAVIKVGEEFLICFNKWRQQWELPAGKREGKETPVECAIRELYEETTQKLSSLEFLGLAKIQKADGEVKYNPIFYGEQKSLSEFRENEEMNDIKLWDLITDADPFDPVDRRILEEVRKRR